MRYHALACDYDGTLARDGVVPEAVWWALVMARQSGRRLLLVTGRHMPDLQEVCPYLELFDAVVAENGALLYNPKTRAERLLAEPASVAFVDALRDKGVPVGVGQAIVSTTDPHQTTVLETIRELGLELEVVFNKSAVMVLPSGVNKATGLLAALHDLGLSAHNVVGIGDAENDHAFLAECECGVAVANAIDALKDRADFVTSGERGEGVVELIQMLLADDLGAVEESLGRHHVPIGNAGGVPIAIPPYGSNVAVAGPSGSGKSTLTTAFLEGLAAARYQYCVIDPEGDYETLEGAVVLGGQDRPPSSAEVLRVLDDSSASVILNLIGIAVDDRPTFFESLLPDLLEMRMATGRPHFFVVDEAHHLLPVQWARARQALPSGLTSMLFVTVHPESLAPAVLDVVDTMIAVGPDPARTLRQFAENAGREPPMSAGEHRPGFAYIWRPDGGEVPRQFEIAQSQQERRRHVRKYAAGDLGDQFAFYFRGPDDRLNLKAQNLSVFLQIADGVDDETWNFHLANGDYSDWFANRIKDEELADAARAIEAAAGTTGPDESRAAIRAAVEKRYTLPA